VSILSARSRISGEYLVIVSILTDRTEPNPGQFTLAESQIGLYKTELIHQKGPWRDVDHVEAATADWVHYFNTERTHASIWDLTPSRPNKSVTLQNKPSNP
jgi:transposase InsO family protein